MTCSVDTVIEERGTFDAEEDRRWTVVGDRTSELDAEGQLLRIRTRDGLTMEVERSTDEVIAHMTRDGFASLGHDSLADGRLVGSWTEFLVIDHRPVPPEEAVRFGFEATRDALGRLLTVTTSPGSDPTLYTWESERRLLIDDIGYTHWELTFDERGAIERVVWSEWHDPCRHVLEEEFPMCPSIHPAGWEEIGVMTRKGGHGDHRLQYVLTGESYNIVLDAGYVSAREIQRYRRGRLVEVVLRRTGEGRKKAQRIRYDWNDCPASVRGEPPWSPVLSEPELLWGWPTL